MGLSVLMTDYTRHYTLRNGSEAADGFVVESVVSQLNGNIDYIPYYLTANYYNYCCIHLTVE